MHENLIVYTAIFGDYDDLHEPESNFSGCDFVCFTDNPALTSDTWRIVYVPQVTDSSAAMNRRYKMLPHKYLSEYSRSLYVDGNIRVIGDPCKLADAYLRENLMAAPPHPERICLHDEAEICVTEGIAAIEEMQIQLKKYSESGFPRHVGLTENNILFRVHNHPSVIAVMEAWWAEYTAGVKRDQLSLPFVAWKNELQIARVGEGPRYTKAYFLLLPHARQQEAPLPTRFARYVTANKRRRWVYYVLSRLVQVAVLFKRRITGSAR